MDESVNDVLDSIQQQLREMNGDLQNATETSIISAVMRLIMICRVQDGQINDLRATINIVSNGALVKMAQQVAAWERENPSNPGADITNSQALNAFHTLRHLTHMLPKDA